MKITYARKEDFNIMNDYITHNYRNLYPYLRDNSKAAKFTTIQKIARVWAFNYANELKIKLPVNRKILIDRIRAVSYTHLRAHET